VLLGFIGGIQQTVDAVLVMCLVGDGVGQVDESRVALAKSTRGWNNAVAGKVK
jgi:hypothetical protein